MSAKQRWSYFQWTESHKLNFSMTRSYSSSVGGRTCFRVACSKSLPRPPFSQANTAYPAVQKHLRSPRVKSDVVRRSRQKTIR